ncbi:MAG: hypothetical protein WCO52_06095 [bacterium]
MDTGERQRKQLDSYADPLNAKDPELAAKIRAKIGTPYRDLVDPNKAVFLNPGHSYNLLGINAHRVRPENREDFAQRMAMGLGQINSASYNALGDPKKTVYGIGNGASPQTMAHEYRHDKINDEMANRIQDLIHSNSRAQYSNNLQSLYEGLYGDRGEKISVGDKEKKVMSALDSRIFNSPEAYPNLTMYAVDTHAAVNSGESQGYMAHPMDYLTGNTVETSVGKIPKTMVEQRNQYPFLNFVGGDISAKKAITLPENYCKGGRVRVI